MSSFTDKEVHESNNCGTGYQESISSTKAKKPKIVETAKKLIPTGANAHPLKRSLTSKVIVYDLKDIITQKQPSNEDVTEEFIKDFNDRRGNLENIAAARRMLLKNRTLAGLGEIARKEYIDIPSARRNLLLLASLNHQEIKIQAMKTLSEVLEADEIKRDTAFDLIVLAIDLMKQMDRELMQTQLVQEQILICQTYGIVAELIQRHYAKKHLGGITAELKTQLINTAKTLEDLNTHGDPDLHIAVEFALEGVKRLRDDRKELFELFERLYHLLLAVGSYNAVVTYNSDGFATFAEHLEKAFDGLDIRIKHSWYDLCRVFNQVAKMAFHDIDKLLLLQSLLKDNAATSDWKYLYNGIVQLAKIALEGDTPAIRKGALMGIKVLNDQYPGLIDYIDFDAYDLKTSYKPMVHFKPPEFKDNNVLIRQICIRSLIKIALESKQESLRKIAKQALVQRSKAETDPTIRELFPEIIPKKKGDKSLWANESSPFEYVTVKTPELKRNSVSSPQTHKPHHIQIIAKPILQGSTSSTSSNKAQTLSPGAEMIAFDNPEDAYIYARGLLKAKQASKALEYLIIAHDKIDKESNKKMLQGNILHQMGLAYLALDKEEKAEQAFLTAINLRPKKTQIYISLGNLYKKQNRTLEANRYLEKASELKDATQGKRAIKTVKSKRNSVRF